MRKHDSWFDRYSSRYVWATRAYDEFVTDLAPEFVESLKRRDQVTVVVYGATQVGKTTLILDLLGIDASTSSEVDKVLRGGQSLGKSATAMPIRYTCSDDDYWYISGEKQASAEAACNKLKEFRRTVEAGEVTDADILDIRIPQRLFGERRQIHHDSSLNIIDLPGLRAINPDERRLVEQLGRRFVSVADLVLLVGRSDDLGFLHPDDLELDVLANWQFQPSRFRIVLTFGFSPDSLFKNFREDGLSVERVRDVLIEEMKTYSYKFPDEFRSRLYVMELGQSLVGLLRKVDSDYCQRIKDINAEFRNELWASISKAAGPYSRLYAAFELDRVIKAKRKNMEESWESHEYEFEIKIKAALNSVSYFLPDLLRGDLQQVKQKIEQNDSEIARLKDYLVEVLGCLHRLKKSDLSVFFRVKFNIPKTETVKALSSELARCEQLQREACINLHDKLQRAEFWKGLDDENPLEFDIVFQRNYLMRIEGVLNKYSVDTYLFSKNFQNDCDSVKNAIEENAKYLGEKLRAEADEYLRKISISIDDKIKNMEKRKTLMRSVALNLSDIEHERVQARIRHDEAMVSMADSFEIAKQFESRVNSAFLGELESVKKQAHESMDPASQFYAMLHTHLLWSELDRMYDGRNF